MKNVLVPISVRLNNLTDDLITVGLLAFNENSSFYDFSYEKLKIVKSFLDKNSIDFLDDALKSMSTTFLKEAKINEIAYLDKILNEKYIDYLSKYSNGIVKFGEPKGFATELNNESYLKAFRSFVGAEPGKIISKGISSLRYVMNEILKNDAFKNVDVKYSIKPSMVSGIYAPHKLDFIGINGSPYAGLAVDFTKDVSEIDKNIVTFRAIALGLASRTKDYDMSPGKYELYFNEPASKENIKLLDRVRKDKHKGFELLEFDKIDRTIIKIENGTYRKFSESEFAL